MKRLILVVLIFANGCASSTGWQVHFGVAPVKSINSQQGLKQEAK